MYPLFSPVEDEKREDKSTVTKLCIYSFSFPQNEADFARSEAMSPK